MDNYKLMAEVLAGRGPATGTEKIFSHLPAGEVGEDETFLPVTIDGRLVLAYPDRLYYEAHGVVCRVNVFDDAVTHFRQGRPYYLPPPAAN